MDSLIMKKPSLIKKVKTKAQKIRAIPQKINSFENQINDLNNRINDLTKLHDLLFDRVIYLNQSSNKLLYDSFLSSRPLKKNFNPLVSIIIPVYNGSNYLAQAIQSAINQSYKNIEIIVVDDGSTESTKLKKIVRSFGNKVSYYRKENGGVSSALNYGIKHMSGDYFAWLSHDDLITPEHIERLVEWYSHEGSDNEIPFSSSFIIDGDGKIMYSMSRDAQFYFSDFKLSLTRPDYNLLFGEINGGAIMIPRKAFDLCGLFDEDQRITQERSFWNKISDHYHLINIPFSTSAIRIHKKQVSKKVKMVTDATNKKILEIIDGLSDNRIYSSFYDKSVLYSSLQRKFENENRNYLSEQMKLREQKLRKGKN